MTNPNPPAGQDVEAVVRGLTKARREALALVCKSNGGGVRIRCRTGDDGYGVPTSAPFRWLFERGLIQGKSGEYETVVHTRDGLSAHRATLQQQGRDRG